MLTIETMRVSPSPDDVVFVVKDGLRPISPVVRRPEELSGWYREHAKPGLCRTAAERQPERKETDQ